MRNINFKKQKGLLPCIIQNNGTGQVLMLGYVDKEALQKTIKEGYVYFFSRSRKKLWLKGEESGNCLRVKQVFLDCDGDALLIKAKLEGKNVCHKGYRSCFYLNLGF